MGTVSSMASSALDSENSEFRSVSSYYNNAGLIYITLYWHLHPKGITAPQGDKKTRVRAIKNLSAPLAGFADALRGVTFGWQRQPRWPPEKNRMRG